MHSLARVPPYITVKSFTHCNKNESYWLNVIFHFRSLWLCPAIVVTFDNNTLTSSRKHEREKIKWQQYLEHVLKRSSVNSFLTAKFDKCGKNKHDVFPRKASNAQEKVRGMLKAEFMKWLFRFDIIKQYRTNMLLKYTFPSIRHDDLA